MITNHILEDKWRVQKELIEEAGHDPADTLPWLTKERWKCRSVMESNSGMLPRKQASPESLCHRSERCRTSMRCRDRDRLLPQAEDRTEEPVI